MSNKLVRSIFPKYKYTGAYNALDAGEPGSPLDEASRIHDHMYWWIENVLHRNPMLPGPVSLWADAWHFAMASKLPNEEMTQPVKAAWVLKHGYTIYNRQTPIEDHFFKNVMPNWRNLFPIGPLLRSVMSIPYADDDLENIVFPDKRDEPSDGFDEWGRIKPNRILPNLNPFVQQPTHTHPPQLPPNVAPPPSVMPPPTIPPPSTSPPIVEGDPTPSYGHRGSVKYSILLMPRYGRRRRPRTFKRKRYRSKRIRKYAKFLAGRPRGAIRDQSIFVTGNVCGQQDWGCLPMSCTNFEMSNYYDSVGRGQTMLADAIYVGAKPKDATNWSSVAASREVITTVKQSVFCDGISREVQIKNNTNVNAEIVFYKVRARQSACWGEPGLPGSAGSDDRFVPLDSLKTNPFEDYNSGAITNAPTGLPIDSSVAGTNITAVEGFDDLGQGFTANYMGYNDSANFYKRHGYHPKENKYFNANFEILSSKKHVIASNQIMHWTWSTKNIRKFELNLDNGKGGIDTSHATKRGQIYLMYCVRGHVVTGKAEDLQDETAENKINWNTTANPAYSNIADGVGFVTTSAAQVIGYLKTHLKITSANRYINKLRAVEHVFNTAGSTYEIDEDGETAHEVKTAFE